MERRGWKILIGCAIGCATVVVIVFGSCTGFVFWLNSPGEVLEPRGLIDPDVRGYVEWTLRLEDPGTREFIDLMVATFQEINERAPSPLPPAIRGPLTELQNRRNERELREFFPVVLVWTVRPAESADRDLHLLSASIRGADHQLIMMDWFLGFFMRRMEEVSTFKHRGETVYGIRPPEGGEELQLFIHRGDVFMATSAEGARLAIDRLEDGPSSNEGTSPVERWLPETEERTLHGVVTNQRGEVWRVWREVLDGSVDDLVAEEQRAALTALLLRGGFTAEGALELTADFHFDDAAVAGAAVGPLSAAVERALRETLIELRGLSVVGRAVRVDMEIADIPGRIEEGAAALEP
jgi:hypothetical protein